MYEFLIEGALEMWKWEAEKEAKGVIVITHNMLEHTGRYAYLITKLRRNGFHVIMGDLPGQGQTSRMNKGQIEKFEVYHERVLDWVRIAEEYELPVFVLGVGLGGLILLNLLERVKLNLEGVILISPLVSFNQSNKFRKKALASNFGSLNKDAKFDIGIELHDLTRNLDVIEDAKDDSLMIRKVSYHWFKEVIHKMKDTMDHLKDVPPIPMCIMYGSEDEISDVKAMARLPKILKTNEMYFKVWEGLFHEIHNEPERDYVLRYILSFLNNRIYSIGFSAEEVK